MAKNDKKKDGDTKLEGELGLKGDAAGSIDRLDGKGVLKGPPDPLVFERGKIHVKNLDELEDAKNRATTSAGELEGALKKTTKAQYVRIPGKHATYVFTVKHESSKLKVEKKDKVN